MQGSVTAVLVNWFASWWQGKEDPNIIKITKRHLAGLEWGSGGVGGMRREGLNNVFPFNVLYHCIYYLN